MKEEVANLPVKGLEEEAVVHVRENDLRLWNSAYELLKSILY